MKKKRIIAFATAFVFALAQAMIGINNVQAAENINHAPVLVNIPEIEALEGMLIKIEASAYDVDGDILSFDYDSPFDANGEWQTQIGDAGVYPITVSVSDSSLEDSQIVNVIVNASDLNDDSVSEDEYENEIENENEYENEVADESENNYNNEYEYENAKRQMEWEREQIKQEQERIYEENKKILEQQYKNDNENEHEYEHEDENENQNEYEHEEND